MRSSKLGAASTAADTSRGQKRAAAGAKSAEPDKGTKRAAAADEEEIQEVYPHGSEDMLFFQQRPPTLVFKEAQERALATGASASDAEQAALRSVYLEYAPRVERIGKTLSYAKATAHDVNERPERTGESSALRAMETGGGTLTRRMCCAQDARIVVVGAALSELLGTSGTQGADNALPDEAAQ